MRSPLLLIAALACAAPAVAANYPLELTNIREGIAGANRISRAYPGIEYNIRAAVIGGAYPYTFTLDNAPSGMTIDSRTGEISWPNPRDTARPTITVVDSEGTRVSAPWTITVTANGFRFIDAVNGRHAQKNGCTGTCGTGTRDSPWRTILDMYRAGAAGDAVYFRSGTYRVTDLPRASVGTPWERVEFAERRQGVIWLAYPGERPVLDFGYRSGLEAGPLIRLQGDNVYVDGFETINSHLIAFQFASGDLGPTFRRLRMHAHGPGVDGANAAFIMTTRHARGSGFSDYGVIQDCEFWGVTGESVTIKIYAQRKLLIENTVHHDAPVALELKYDVPQFTVRGNTFYDVASTAIGGNMHLSSTSGEILFNNVRAGLALDLNQDGMAREIHVYRNTFIGRVQVRNTDAQDGPFYLSNNVIVNNDRGTPGGSHVYHAEVIAPNRIILSNNIAGKPSDDIVDAKGRLTGAYQRHTGTLGHVVGAGATPQDKQVP